MAYSIGYYTSATQATELVKRYSDYTLPKLPPVDRAILLAVLSAYVYINLPELNHTLNLLETAEQFIPEHLDRSTEEAFTALDLLNGISRQDAIGVMQFLLQGGVQ